MKAIIKYSFFVSSVWELQKSFWLVCYSVLASIPVYLGFLNFTWAASLWLFQTIQDQAATEENSYKVFY